GPVEAGRHGGGAVEENVRLCKYIYRPLGAITQIAATLDTHRAMQIFHPVFWVNEAGEHPAGGQTIISLEDVERGVWRVNPAVAGALRGWGDGGTGRRGDGGTEGGGPLTSHDSPLTYPFLQRHALHYVRRLREGGKYRLMVWPYHAMLGGIGHALVSAVEEAFFFHAIARSSQTGFEIKGD